MMAEVGGIVKVNGNRMAIPFAPPRPGKTPMITPSVTPTSMSSKLNGVIATAKPLNRALISSNLDSFFSNLFNSYSYCTPKNSSGLIHDPCGNGTWNQYSNMKYRAALTPTATATAFQIGYLPSQTIKMAM